jgi:hypothetical protein
VGRKWRQRAIMPRIETRMLYMEHIADVMSVARVSR